MFHKAPRWLVVFLGNPGNSYRDTRHNVGFMTADVIERRENIKMKRIKYSALTAICRIGEDSVLLMKPQTYMNLSGQSVRPASAFYKIPPERVIVVSDDVTLEAGRLRIRRKGSSGGHNGLKSIISELGSDQFPRIRIGVGAPPHQDYSMIDWVMGKFHGEDIDIMEKAIDAAANAVETIISSGTDEAMSRFN